MNFFERIEDRIGFKTTFYLRWGLFIPAGLIAMIFTHLLFVYLSVYSTNSLPNLKKYPYLHLFFKSIRGGFIQSSFIFVSLWVVPKFKYVICYIYIILHFVIISLVFVVIVMSIIKSVEYGMLVFDTIGMVTSLIFCFYMKKQIKISGDVLLE